MKESYWRNSLKRKYFGANASGGGVAGGVKIIGNKQWRNGVMAAGSSSAERKWRRNESLK